MAPKIEVLVPFLLCLATAFIPSLNANLLESDDYLKQLEKEYDPYWWQKYHTSIMHNQAAAFLDPFAISGNFTAAISMDILGKNGGRRMLKGKNKGAPCLATNPIDRCWRCDPHWADNRQRLADCVMGFGKNTKGGKGGKYYVITDPSDDDLLDPKPGTLRHAVTRTEPLWIIFSRSMVITLQQELIMAGNKTIDGRGFDVHIAHGAGLTIQFIQNVIIHGIKIHNIVSKSGGMIRDSETHYGHRTQSDGDGISIFGGSNIWIDHVSMRNCSDGLIDVIMGSTAITISNGHYTDHDHVMLFGASNTYSGDKIMQITLAFNHYGKRLVQRMPRVRYGFVHVVNNDYTHWEMYAIGGNQNPTIISEGNRFIAPENRFAKEITKREYTEESVWKSWQWRSINDEYLNGAFFIESGPELKNRPFSSKDMITAKPGTYVGQLTRYAGVLPCKIGHPC